MNEQELFRRLDKLASSVNSGDTPAHIALAIAVAYGIHMTSGDPLSELLSALVEGCSDEWCEMNKNG